MGVGNSFIPCKFLIYINYFACFVENMKYLFIANNILKINSTMRTYVRYFTHNLFLKQWIYQDVLNGSNADIGIINDLLLYLKFSILFYFSKFQYFFVYKNSCDYLIS